MRATSQGKRLRNMVQVGLGSNVISSLSCNQKRPETTWFHQYQTTINSTSTDIPIDKTGWNSSSSFIKFCQKRGVVVFNYSALVSMRWEKPLIHHNFYFFHSACILVHFEYFPKFIHYTCCCLTNSKSLPITFGSILASRAETSCGTYSSCKVSSGHWGLLLLWRRFAQTRTTGTQQNVYEIWINVVSFKKILGSSPSC